MFSFLDGSMIGRQWRRLRQPQKGQPPAIQSDGPPARVILKGRDISSEVPSLPAFGPLHRGDNPLFSLLKEEAWQRIVISSGGDQDTIMEVYITNLGSINEEARSCYGEVDGGLTEGTFKEMMIKDGSLFLHVALLLLGVVFPGNDGFFSKALEEEDRRRWMKGMLFVGNQIPFVVLKKLMKQAYFKDIIESQGKWEKPPGLFRMALYELLVSPGISWDDTVGDLLHGLQRLVLGMEPKPSTTNYGSRDIESGRDINDEKPFLSATEMKQSGIRVKTGAAGSRGIQFTTNVFYGASLSLPPITMDDNTGLVFQALVEYEALQESSSGHKCEVTSYLRLMKDMVRGTEDLRILGEEGIIVPPDHMSKEMLLGILVKLDCKNHTTLELHTVRLLTRYYTRSALWGILSFFIKATVVLTFLMALANLTYSILSFHLGTKRR